jgi:O-antigen ligase/Flp pilus assembly protein TadD
MIALVLSVSSTCVVSMELFNPFVTTKALWLRACVALALPFYVHLLLVNPALRPNLKNPLTLAVITYVFLAVLSAVFGVNRIRSFWGNYERMGGAYHLIHLTLLYFYLLLIARAKGERVVRRLLLLLVWIAALSSLYGIFVALGMPPWVPDSGMPRVSSLFGNPGFFASFLILPMALTLLFWHEAKTATHRIVYFALFASQLTGIAISGTRAVLLGVAAAAFLAGVALIVARYDSFSRYTGIALLSALVVCILLLFAGHRFSNEFLLKRFASLQDDSTRIRVIEWRTAWQGYKERPLLGTGLENYYIVADKYFDKNMYKYGNTNITLRADKPHNNLLEVLVTMGLGGLLLYLGVLGTAGLAFWKAFRANVISWTGCVILASGIVAYEIQDLFWFDTPAASVTFYTYLGLASCLWTKIGRQPLKQQNSARTGIWGTGVLALTALACLYCVFVTDGVTAVVLRNLNRALNTRNVDLAKAYFDKAAESEFLYDRGELRTRYVDFVGQLSGEYKDQADLGLTKATIDDAIAVSDQVTRQGATEPRVWLGLAYLYLERSRLQNAPPDPRAYAAVQKAIALAPNQIEPLLMLAHYDALDKRPDQALAISEDIVRTVPEYALARWRLALMYRDLHRDEPAIQTATEALRLGYRFQPSELAWLINCYADRQDYKKVAELYERAVVAAPADFQLYASLAATYDKLGEREHAIAAAQKALLLNPSLEPYVKRFIALPATRSVSSGQ